MTRNEGDNVGFNMSETSLGEELKLHRGNRSLREIARITGISEATLSRIEAGKIELPGKETLAALSRGYGMPIEHLAQLAYLGAGSA